MSSTPSVLTSDSNIEVMPKSWCQTTKKRSLYCFEWTIHEFSSYGSEVNRKVKSVIFSTGANDEVKWQMEFSMPDRKIFPAGANDEMRWRFGFRKPERNLLFVSLQMLSGIIDEKNKYQISLLDAKREKVEVDQWTSVTTDNFQCDRSVKVATFYVMVFPANLLTLRCEMIVWDNPINNVPESSLVQDLGDLLDNPEFSDFEVCVGDKVFPVHKNILATRSSVFRAMFEHDMKEKHENRVHITDMDSEVVHQMLRFIYTDKVDTDKLVELAVELLGAADKYDLKRLRALCEHFLCDNLTVENCGEMLDLANMHKAEQLQSYAMDYINWNADRVEGTSGWKLMLVSEADVQDKQIGAINTQPKSPDTQEQK